MVAPLTRAGRGLKHQPIARPLVVGHVAPLTRAGRGLKQRVPPDRERREHVAPLTRAGRGLKQYDTAKELRRRSSPRSHERGAD